MKSFAWGYISICYNSLCHLRQASTSIILTVFMSLHIHIILRVKYIYHTHTHTHTHISKPLSVCVCVLVCVYVSVYTLWVFLLVPLPSLLLLLLLLVIVVVLIIWLDYVTTGQEWNGNKSSLICSNCCVIGKRVECLPAFDVSDLLLSCLATCSNMLILLLSSCLSFDCEIPPTNRCNKSPHVSGWNIRTCLLYLVTYLRH